MRLEDGEAYGILPASLVGSLQRIDEHRLGRAHELAALLLRQLLEDLPDRIFGFLGKTPLFFARLRPDDPRSECNATPQSPLLNRDCSESMLHPRFWPVLGHETLGYPLRLATEDEVSSLQSDRPPH